MLGDDLPLYIALGFAAQEAPRLSDAAAGRCSCSKAFTRSARRMAGTPRAFNSSAMSRLAASAIQCSRGSRSGFSNGITRMRAGSCAHARLAASGSEHTIRSDAKNLCSILR